MTLLYLLVVNVPPKISPGSFFYSVTTRIRSYILANNMSCKMRKPRTAFNFRQNTNNKQFSKAVLQRPDRLEGRIKSPTEEFMEKDEVIKLELAAKYFFVFLYRFNFTCSKKNAQSG